MPSEIIFVERDNKTAIITLNRPKRLNALSIQLKKELVRTFSELEKDDSVWAVILTGGPKAFCAGADIKERSKTSLSKNEFYNERMKNHEFFKKIEKFEKPVIAAINGVAVGGGLELALVCDFRIASETARFGLPEVKIGAIPSGGGTQRLPRLIGIAKAKELLFTANIINAEEAESAGLVSAVVPVDKLMPSAMALAEKISNNAPLAVRMAKRSVNMGMEMDLNAALDCEAQCAAMLAESKDREEGFKAFLEKRKPEYKGF
jgi:enoyl-CoA hydratase/carnithine racemase